MSDIFPDIFEAIRILRQEKGITKNDIFIFVHERLGKACTIKSILKTMKALNKLVEDGLLLKKGRRYMLPLPKENKSEKVAKKRVVRRNEIVECRHREVKDENEDDEEEDDNENEEEDEDDDDDDECNLDDRRKPKDPIKSSVNKNENKNVNSGGKVKNNENANAGGNRKNGERNMIVEDFGDYKTGYGNGKCSEYLMDEEIPMKRDDSSNWDLNDHDDKLRKSYLNTGEYSFRRSKKIEQGSRRKRLPSEACDKTSRSRSPGRRRSDDTDVMMDTEENLPESVSDARLNNSDLSFEYEEKDEQEGDFNNFRYRSPNGPPPPNTPGVHLDRKESCCSDLENTVSSDKDKDGKDGDTKENILSKQEASLKRGNCEASLCSLCGKKKLYHDLGYDKGYNQNHGTC